MFKVGAGYKIGGMLTLSLMMAGAAQPAGCDTELPVTGMFAGGESRYVLSKDVHGFPDSKFMGWGEATLVDDGAAGYLADSRWYVWASSEAFLDHPSKPDCVVEEGPLAQPGTESAFPDTSFESCDGCMAYYAESIEGPRFSEGCAKEIIDYWTSDPSTGEPLLSTVALTGFRDGVEDGFPEEWADDVKWLEEEGALGVLYYSRFTGDGSFAPEFVVFDVE